MAYQQGINTKFHGAFESTFGSPPATGYFDLPFISHTLGEERPNESDDVLGNGRKPREPEKGTREAGGNVIVPIEAESFGFWLKALFGAPTTTGTGPYTHVFEAGNATSLPSLSLETWMPQVPFSSMVAGSVANTLAIDIGSTGRLQATIGFLAQKEDTDTVSNAGTPTAFSAYTRLPASSAALQRNGSALTSKGESGALNVSNDLEALRFIDGTGVVGEIQPRQSLVNGTVQLRFGDTTMLQQAIDKTASTLTIAMAPGGTESLTFLMHEVYLPRPKVEVPGPGGVQANFEYSAVADPSTAKQMTVTLVNNTASY